MNPVILAVDAGHVQHGPDSARFCEMDNEPWPCTDIVAARLLLSSLYTHQAVRKPQGGSYTY